MLLRAITGLRYFLTFALLMLSSRTYANEITEQEFNNNVAQATVAGNIPFQACGAISTPADIDDFKFSVSPASVTQRQVISFVLLKDAAKFVPTLAIIDDRGNVTSPTEISIKQRDRIGATYLFFPKRAGNYNLSVSDRYGHGSANFSYQVAAFFDQDRDGAPDSAEPTLGLDPTRQDSDGDGTLDGNDYWQQHTPQNRINKAHQAKNMNRQNDAKPSSTDVDDGKKMRVNVQVPTAYRGLKGPFTLEYQQQPYATLAQLNHAVYLFNGSSAKKLTIYNSDTERVLQTIALPSNNAVSFSLESTAKAMALSAFISGKSEQQVQQLLGALTSIDEFQQLRQYLQQGIEKHPKQTMAITNREVAVLIYEIQEKLRQQGLG